MLNADASARRPIQKMPKRRRSGKRSPGRMAYTYSGRERDADNRQPPAAAVDDRGHTVAWIEPVGFAEQLARQDFVGPRRVDPAAASQEHVVQRRPPRSGSEISRPDAAPTCPEHRA